MKEVPERLIKELETDYNLKKIFKIAKQTVNDGKHILGN